MQDDQTQTVVSPATQAPAAEVVSIDPAQAALGIVEQQPWAKDAGLAQDAAAPAAAEPAVDSTATEPAALAMGSVEPELSAASEQTESTTRDSYTPTMPPSEPAVPDVPVSEAESSTPSTGM